MSLSFAANFGSFDSLNVRTRCGASWWASRMRCTDRACQVHTTGFALPDRRMISAVPQPSAVARMIWARHTCFCRLSANIGTVLQQYRSLPHDALGNYEFGLLSAIFFQLDANE